MIGNTALGLGMGANSLINPPRGGLAAPPPPMRRPVAQAPPPGPVMPRRMPMGLGMQPISRM